MRKDKNREELIEEIKLLQQQVAKLEIQDVERKRTEEQLRQSQQRMHLAASVADLGLWEWDLESDAIWATEEGRARVGAAESEQIALDHFLQFVHPDDRERTRQGISHSIESTDQFEIEYRMNTVNKGTRWMTTRAQVECNSNGKPLRIRGVSIDITERKQAEEALKQSERRLIETQRMAQLGNWELDPVTNKLIWSDEIFRIFEIDKEHFSPSYEFFLSTVHPDDRKAVDAAYRQSVEVRKPYEITHRLLMPDGRIKYVQERCETDYSSEGKPLRSIGTVQDITEREKLREQVEIDVKEWQNTFDTVSDLIMILDCEFRIIQVNKSTISFFSLPQEQIIGRHCHRLMHTASWVFEDCPVVKALKTKKHEDATVYIDQKDVWLLVSAAPICDDQGTITGFIHTAKDITERKKIEEEILKNQERLQYFARKLMTVQEEERSRLARELHDDFTQRLAVLAIDLSKVERLAKATNTTLEPEIRNIRDQIVKLSTDIHDISRQLHPSIIDDLGLGRAIQSKCSNFTRRTGILVNYESIGIPSMVPRDISVGLFRITQEALRNIQKYADVEKAEVFLVCEEGYITLMINDSGAGFDLEHKSQPHGLGLFSMQERTQLMDGVFSIDSAPGQGTQIKVVVPL